MNEDGTYEKSTLPNGVRVVTERVPHIRSASIGVWVAVGSSHEDAAVRGISHCIEHMLFKGTSRRSARDIAETMDGVGGHLNAFTDKESTCYHARVVDTHMPLAVELLADMFQDSVFDPDELHKEQQVILEEIKMYDDSPDEVSQDLFLKTAWGGSALGEPTIGYAQTVSAIGRQTILDYMASRYTPSSVVISAVGDFEHEAFLEQARLRFGGMRGGEPHADPAPPVFRPVDAIQRKDCEQVYLIAGAEGTSAADERRYAFSVLDTILGGGMASRLFQEIREKRGLVYSVYSTHNMYRRGGLFAVSASTRPKNAREVLSLIRDELVRLVEHGVRDDEVVRAKEHIKGALALSLESMSARMLRLGRTELVAGRAIPPSEVIAKIDAVTKEQVEAIARVAFAPTRLSLTVLGPVDERFEDEARLARSA
jgi:predicted Zn-dependent peptidase